MSHNDKAITNLTNVARNFSTNPTIFPRIKCNNSIGIEVEVKFRHYFPEIFDKYFRGKTWDSYTQEEKVVISEEITEQEQSSGLRDKLNKITKLGIKKGCDRYWEFALDPVTDLSIILTQLKLLRDLDVLPEGNHSLHLTIGDIVSSEEVYWIFALCELMFSSKERVHSGFNKDKRITYFKKGSAGLVNKRWRLEECKKAVEFRSLELVVHGGIISITHDKLTYVANLLNDEYFRSREIDRCKALFEEVGLPNKNWKNYSDNPDIWDSYYQNYDYIKETFK